MAESVINKRTQYSGVKHSSNATLCKRMNVFFTKFSAFTLAETLVVMGIIGVVVELTIPNLNQSTGDREKVAMVKKVYSNLEVAFGRATALYGSIDEGFTNLPEDITENQRLADRNGKCPNGTQLSWEKTSCK